MSDENENQIGRLENEALKRKERLKALKSGALRQHNPSSEIDSALPIKPIFRNYNPNDDNLKTGVLPKPDLIRIEQEIKDQLENSTPQPLIQNEIELSTLAPQKIDWDLKRDVEKKLKILESRTQKAIIELIRDRLQANKNGDFAELVSVGSKQPQKHNDDDDSQEED